MREKKKCKKFKFTSELRVSAREFIDDKDTDAYRSFHMQRVGTKELEILSDDLELGTRERTIVIRTVPGIKLPRLVARVVPNGKVEFVDTRKYLDGAEKKTPFAQAFTTVNNITKHSVVKGTITVRETGARTCVVEVEGECQVALRGIGGIIENIVVDGIRKAYELLPEITREWCEYKAKVASGEIAPVKPPAFPVTNRSTVKRSGSASTLGEASFYSARETSLRERRVRGGFGRRGGGDEEEIRSGFDVCVLCVQAKGRGDGLLVRNVSAFT